ncbi:MarR family winged helix-turn-helix transcriptional regulator [Roseibium sp. FZY0029]|uniref:MarR family winged helix-turn-helix transcriptional regulator n=1 Tax=Roseibium sp. FZY0029 TaxID=3116647 RepID=UPI002EC7EB3C|nr:MarR family winged helix-turn-helix transcriptional regulator [Roseibium sp. FZY0029]
MSKSTPTPPAAIDAWARLQRASGAVLARVETRLKADGFPPLGWYDVLLELSRAEDRTLRPVEIEKRMLLAQYNVSRLLDRLAAAGYIEKLKSPEDGRGVSVRVTSEGEALLKAMWPCYQAAVEAEFTNHLEPGDAETLWDVLGRLVR